MCLMNSVCLCAAHHLILRRSVSPADTAYVRVFISDVNDNKPLFAQRLYEVGVDENADVGLAVVTVSATDEDEGIRFMRQQTREVRQKGFSDAASGNKKNPER